MDHNDEILRIINSRMEIGLERYGHGIRIQDNTKQWGTDEDSWAEMALEEVLDMTIYIAAELLRIKAARTGEWPSCPITPPETKSSRLSRIKSRVKGWFK